MKKFILVLFLLSLGSWAYAKQTATLNIVIQDIKSNEGKLEFCLFKSEGEYKKVIFEGGIDCYRKDRIKISGQEQVYIIGGLPFGEYAYAIRHDANNNGKLDKNFLGIPVESYNFSNNSMGMMGPPSYEQAKFIIGTKNVTVTANMR